MPDRSVEPPEAAPTAPSKVEGASPKRPEIALEGLLAEVRALEQAGDAAGARARLAAPGDRFLAYAGFHLANGTLAFRDGQLDLALAAFEEAVRLEPGVAELHGNLGAARLERARRTGAPADLAAATDDLERAAALEPKLPGPLVSLGAAYLASDRPGDAIEALERALRLDPREPAIWFNLGAACHALGRDADAIAAFDRALVLAPGMKEAELARAKLLAAR